MRKTFTNAAILTFALILCAISQTATAQNYGIVFGDLEVTEENAHDIFGDGMAEYIPDENALILQPNFSYKLSKGKVLICTGNDFTIRLHGNAEFSASVECADPLYFETGGKNTLKITSNISGSALKCKMILIPGDLCLDLLSRNSQEDMYAFDCDEITIEGGTLFAEVTTASLAVKTEELIMNGSYMLKPKGGSVNPLWGGICFDDGTPAKQVKIVPFNYNAVNEEDFKVENNVQKTFENGQIIIIKDGIRYNVAGQRLN